MRNTEIRDVMKLGHISIRDLAQFMDVTTEWAGRIVRAELSKRDRHRVLTALDEVLALREKELKQAMDLRKSC